MEANPLPVAGREFVIWDLKLYALCSLPYASFGEKDAEKI
jgi:hypothetical protein